MGSVEAEDVFIFEGKGLAGYGDQDIWFTWGVLIEVVE